LLEAPQFQLGGENNTEKSRCLAQLQKKIHMRCVREPGFSGIRAARSGAPMRHARSLAVFSGT
jgi:hypothetical protein